MQIDGILSGLFAAVVVGTIARLIVRGYQPIGCLLTLLIGLVGAAAGAWLGDSLDWGWILTFGVQVLIGALLVLPFTVATRDRF